MVEKKTLTKTLIQHSGILSKETFAFLKDIAEDYAKVKNQVYQRYSGIKNVDRLTPVYTVLNEMRHCGLRQQLGLPSAYYELAVSDAVSDIKGNWGILKNKINDLIKENENLTQNDRIYIRTVMKMNNIFSAVLNCQTYEMPNNVKGLSIQTERCNNLMRRLVRRYLTVPRTEAANMFRVTPGGYRYGDGGIWLTGRKPRQRIYVPLKDDRTFERQILVVLCDGQALLKIPVEAKIKKHKDYTATIYIHIGNKNMFTLSNGNIYGCDLEDRVFPETLRLNQKNQKRSETLRNYKINIAEGNTAKALDIKRNNLGKYKYESEKQRERAKTQDYINTEINRMISYEKPTRIVITKPVTKNKTKHKSKTTNLKLNRNFNGYIRKRLAFKCQIHSIELIEINSKGTGSICAICGAEGKLWSGTFVCEKCGRNTSIAINSAENIERIAKSTNIG